MLVLGIETSCDECSIAVVEDGKTIRSNIVATQIDLHREFDGVVPEIASRLHTEWISSVFRRSLEEAGIAKEAIDVVAVTSRPGLIGSLLVGLSFAKGLAFALGKPLVTVDHIRAHLYAPHLEHCIDYPYLGLLVSGGHTVIGIVREYDSVEVLGTTIDDACGEAFDKVAKHYKMGYPGGVAIDKLAKQGDDSLFSFPDPSLHKGDHRYDVSYSGLKTAVINQIAQFTSAPPPYRNEDIAASFQKAAVGMLMKRLRYAIEDTDIRRVVAGGGVVANSRLRRELSELEDVEVIVPSMRLCTDNGAMIAGLGYMMFINGITSSLAENASSRVAAFRRGYP
ncbi:tRNA (adenosine(37)-N6)-threonylcarbamoyltransferase complex transferase subunit TsaD [Sediminispirochaeta bajacaliforniensis]|uniref:tRNA (adenosine(37)-N6)-threonylcarbamoyltransferase complex transferase subunit TsaD n=1 Tax=Sediminispirochaeta bajacaliforniensis TaxID=148 RepID=UPI00036919B5|nr:tRNA (adenosine(37)-N6)-threonylcarbamoyltransferase complex transferase subunit TsaD [Sediminispirochaeta bajacaliforniensis]